MGSRALRIQRFQRPRPPEEIPVAGVTLHDLLGDPVTRDDVIRAFPGRDAAVSDVISEDDEVRRFRTPAWTWANMAGVEGFVVMRSGSALCWIVTRMN